MVDLRSPTDVVLSPKFSGAMAVAYRWTERQGCQFNDFEACPRYNRGVVVMWKAERAA